MTRFACGLAALVAASLIRLPAGAQTLPPSAVPAPAQAERPASPAQPLPRARWTAAEVRESFDLADSDSDGELTRAEAQRLTILPRSFEEMDQNKDGVLARAEYEAAVNSR